MKKIFSVLLVLVMILGLAACGGSDDKKEETTAAAKEETTAAKEETTAAAKDETAAPEGGDTGNIHEIYLVEDRNCLNGLVSPDDLVDRSDIEKALPTEPKDDLLCGIAIHSLRNTYYVEVQNTCMSTCEGYGYSVNCLIAEDSVDRMVANIDTFITQGCDVIGVNGDVTVLTQVSTTCIEAGIPIIGISAISEEPTHMITTISASDFLNGFSAGERAGQVMSEAGIETIHAVYIPGIAGVTMCDSRGCGTVAGIVYARL